MVEMNFQHLWSKACFIAKSEIAHPHVEGLFCNILEKMMEIENIPSVPVETYIKIEMALRERLINLLEAIAKLNGYVKAGDIEGVMNVTYWLGVYGGEMDIASLAQEAYDKGVEKGITTPKKRNRPNPVKARAFDLFRRAEAAGVKPKISSMALQLERSETSIYNYLKDFNQEKLKLN